MHKDEPWLIEQGGKVIKSFRTIDGDVKIYELPGEPPWWKISGDKDSEPIDYAEYVRLCDEKRDKI